MSTAYWLANAKHLLTTILITIFKFIKGKCCFYLNFKEVFTLSLMAKCLSTNFLKTGHVYRCKTINRHSYSCQYFLANQYFAVNCEIDTALIKSKKVYESVTSDEINFGS